MPVNDPDPLTGELREIAAYWLSLRRSGDMTTLDEGAFRAWLEEDAAHLALYRHLERQWAFLGMLAEEPAIMAAREEDAALFDRPRTIRRMTAVAAACVLAVTTSWALVDSGLVGVGGVGAEAELPVYRTAHGERSDFRLTDGSRVMLDTDSEIRVREMDRLRSVELVRGRAFFDVAKDAARPFSVAAGDKRVRALGTSFDVRLGGGDSEDVVVTLVEGRVRIDQRSLLPWKRHSTEMQAGRQLVAADTAQWAQKPVDIAKETSWVSGQLTFLGDPLAHALAEVNRYAPQKVVFRGGAVPERNIVGVFRAGDVDGFVTAIELNGLGHVVSRTDQQIELAAD
ncbi:FecR family protein [Sphingomonas sp. C3-2]|uniref:FecR family protein n=1 Tax=Sphingomonas sp. C3-2 TaxID=3062169 RepID=UPI00294AC66C|nr:FecR domain-containing protein [Sphingomonas sp. C3-2]WOK35779.1 FecR domain-containing protein [Sphingomonas sp. C3-2]